MPLKKASYRAIIGMNLMRKGVEPGDILTLTLRNEDTDGMYKQAKRLMDMFVQCYGFWPQSIAVHPDHLDLLKKQGKTLDILLDEKAAAYIGELINLTDLPRRIPLEGDSTLDLFTALARFTFAKEDAKDIALAALSTTFGINLEK
jgi:hypothetical protein